MSERDQFESRAAEKLRLPVELIQSARNGDRYLHAFDSMNVMQPLNGWWDWWQASREALKAEQEYPDKLPCPVLLEPGLRFGKGVKTSTMLGALQRRAEYYAEREAMTPEQIAEEDEAIEELRNMLGVVIDKGEWQAAPTPPSQPHPIDTTSQQYETLAKGEKGDS